MLESRPNTRVGSQGRTFSLSSILHDSLGPTIQKAIFRPLLGIELDVRSQVSKDGHLYTRNLQWIEDVNFQNLLYLLPLDLGLNGSNSVTEHAKNSRDSSELSFYHQ